MAGNKMAQMAELYIVLVKGALYIGAQPDADPLYTTFNIVAGDPDTAMRAAMTKAELITNWRNFNGKYDGFKISPIESWVLTKLGRVDGIAESLIRGT